MTLLVKPQVQSFVDPVIGSVTTTTAAVPGASYVVGGSSSRYFSKFVFASGVHFGTQDMNALFVDPPSFNPDGLSILAADGDLWTSNGNSVGGVLNIIRVDIGIPFVVAAAWGDFGGNVPAGVPTPLSHAYLAMGTTRWLVQGSFETSKITVLRAEPPAYPAGHFGFWGHSFASFGAFNVVCAGPQSSVSATAYWTTQPFSIFGAGFGLGKTVISAGADAYNPATWPTANVDIASTDIKHYAPTDFDAAWGAITFFSGPAYDHTDGHVIVQVEGSGGGNGAYIAKLSTVDGHVIWKVAVANGDGFSLTLSTQSIIEAGIYYYYSQTSAWGGTAYAINTADGSAVTGAFTGLSALDNQISNDLIGCIMGDVSWDTTHGSIVLLNATAASGSTMGAVYFATQIESNASAFSDTQFFGQGP